MARPVKLIAIGPDKEKVFQNRLAQLKKHAPPEPFDIHRGRARVTTAKECQCAEGEAFLCPLAGVESDEGRVCITAAVAGLDPEDLIVDVLPDTVVVESSLAKGPTRHAVFTLNRKIIPSRARAVYEGGNLTIVAPTTEPLTEACPTRADDAQQEMN